MAAALVPYAQCSDGSCYHAVSVTQTGIARQETRIQPQTCLAVPLAGRFSRRTSKWYGSREKRPASGAAKQVTSREKFLRAPVRHRATYPHWFYSHHAAT